MGNCSRSPLWIYDGPGKRCSGKETLHPRFSGAFNHNVFRMLTSHRLTLPPTISGLLCGFLGLIGLLCFGCKQTPRNPCGNVDQITYHGYTYGLVNIGDQCWFSENLRTSRYRSGGKITLNPEPWDLYSLGAATFFRTPTENQYDPYRLESDLIFVNVVVYHRAVGNRRKVGSAFFPCGPLNPGWPRWSTSLGASSWCE